MTIIKTFSFDHATRATVKNPYVYSAASVTFISFHVPDFMICLYRGGAVGATPPPLFNYLLFILLHCSTQWPGQFMLLLTASIMVRE